MLAPAGDIKGMTVPWLFQCLRKESQTGTATFTREHAVIKGYLKNGEIIYAASNLETDQLAPCLLRAGKLTQAQHDAAIEITKKTGKSIGAVLVERGFISPRDLVDCAKLQVKQIILNLFLWQDGRYLFEAGALPLTGIVPLPMNTGELVIEGIRGLDWQTVRKSLPSLKTVLRPTADQWCIVHSARLEQDYHTVFSLIDGKKSIEELCTASGIGDFNTLRAIYMLLALTMCETGAAKTDVEMERAREASRRSAAPAAEQKQSEQRPEAVPADESAPVTRESIEQAFAGLPLQNHYQVLGIAAGATDPEVKKAYLRLAKAYHPDRHMDPTMGDLHKKLEQLFSAITSAYQTLSDPARRREYDRAGTVQKAPAQYEEKRAEEYVENYAEKTKRAAAYFNKGMKDYGAGNFWGAAESFAWATRLDPVKAEYSYQYGVSLSHIPRRKHEAEEHLRKAIEIDPLKPEYYLELGTLYLKSGLKAKALAVYNEALRENPNVERIKEAIKSAGGELPQEAGEGTGFFKKMFKDKNPPPG